MRLFGRHNGIQINKNEVVPGPIRTAKCPWWGHQKEKEQCFNNSNETKVNKLKGYRI